MTDNNIADAINSVLLRRIKAERNIAIREFAERLKEVDDYVSPLDIDNLVKEMTEDTL